MASQALVGDRRRREVSEGSLPPMRRAPLALIGAVGAEREGDITSARDLVGGGQGILSERNSAEENGDVTGGRLGGGSGCVGTSSVATTTGLK